MPFNSQPINPTSPANPARWKERLRRRFHRNEYALLSSQGATPSTSSASGHSVSDSQHQAGDDSSRLEEDVWIDKDTLDSHAFPDSVGSLSEELRLQEARVESLDASAERCKNSTVKEEGQSQAGRDDRPALHVQTLVSHNGNGGPHSQSL